MFLKGLNAGAWNEAVTNLRDVGLLAPESGGEERLDAHPLVREYFADLLRRDHPAAWREGHRRLYEHLRGKAKELPDTIEEMAPLYAAVVHGCRAGKNQEALVEVLLKRIRRGASTSASRHSEPAAARQSSFPPSSIRRGSGSRRGSPRRPGLLF